MKTDEELTFEEFLGKTIVSIEKSEDNESLTFTTDTGATYLMYHVQDCCEKVYIEDICGDLEDVMNSEILLAEEVKGSVNIDERTGEYDEWTFYKLSTIKGSVTIRWFSSSNGYYSTSVSVYKTLSKNEVMIKDIVE